MLLESVKAQKTVERLLAEKHEPIAVVGMGLRFPGGATTPDEFEAFLREGRSGIVPLPTDRWETERFVPQGPDEKGRIRTSGGGFLDRIDLFDNSFFNISPKEAQYIDPQQRLLLETAWHALEDANIDPTALRRGNGGVYIGASSVDYALEIDRLPYEELDEHLASGITLFPLSGRLSYFLGWRGPSVSIDTACSSSLCALHMAVQGLRGGECDIALSGGVNLLHSPRIMVMFSHGQMLAEDGQCKTFDESADGYVRAEGCGVLVLKRLSDAERDGDNVLALIRGTAIGQDGDSAGLTVPNGPAQELTIRNALAAARLAPRDIQYVEAHGTGTPLGDPIELGAISDVFMESHTKDEPLFVGSVKTNLGHMEPASGVVGIIKAVLQLRTATIYPHLNFRTPSARIPWDRYPVSIPTECVPWKAQTRRAVVNSFGFAGTIAAVVLEQAAELPASQEPEVPQDAGIFTVSGKSEAALGEQIESYRRYLAERPEADIRQLCYTTNVGRAHFPHRLAGIVSDRDSLLKLLDSGAAEPARAARSTKTPRKSGFLFSGQGTQYVGMGADLYRRFPLFRKCVDTCDRMFAEHLPVSVRDLLLGETDEPGLIDRTQYTQPALFTLEYALAHLWMSWGVRPSVLIGHSIGEVSAATVAGLFDLPDAVTLVAVRARLMQSVKTAGGMVAVSAGADDVAPLLAGFPGLALAAVNAPAQCVVSGVESELEKLAAVLRERGRRVDRLSVSHAFHSPLMAETFDEFRAAIAGITFHEPTIPLVSNLTGRIARFAELATPEYWVRHIGEPVLFMDGMRAVGKRGRHVLIEIGPSTALTALARQCLDPADHVWIASLRRRDSDAGVQTISRGLMEIYQAKLPVDWEGVHAGTRMAKDVLPGYAFQRRPYWLPVNGGRRGSTAGAGSALHPLLGREATSTEAPRPEGVREFAAECAPDSPLWLADTCGADGTPVLPPAAYVELLLSLNDAVHGHTRGTVRDLRLLAPLAVPRDTGVVLRTRLTPRPQGDAEVEVFSLDAEQGAQERLHAVAVLDNTTSPEPVGAVLPSAAPSGLPAGEHIPAADVYTDLASVGREFGASSRNVTGVVRYADGTVTAELSCRPTAAVEQVPPEVLDSALHAIAATAPGGPALSPARFAGIRLGKKPRSATLRMTARTRSGELGALLADVVLYEGDEPVIELTGVEMAPPPAGDAPSFVNRLSWLRHSLPGAPGAPEAPEAPEAATRHVLLLGRPDRLTTQSVGLPGIRVTRASGSHALPAALAAGDVTDVCWFWEPSPEPMSAERLRTENERNYRDLLAVVAALTDAGPAGTARLWLITERAQWLPEDLPDTGEDLPAGTLWGFGHTLLNEYPKLCATLVDLDAASDPAVLAAEWRAPDTGEYQIAYRSGRRYVRRLLDGSRTPSWPGGFEARTASGEVVPADDAAPAPGQIQVRVHTACLEHGEEGPCLGSGAVGTVIAAGTGASFRAGHKVRLVWPGTLRATVTVPSSAAVPEPDGEPYPGTGTYRLDELPEALGRLAEKGAGERVAVRVADDEPAPAGALVVRPDLTYLVTGGLGGLGLVTASKLVDLGARHLTLLSRSGRPTAEAAEAFAALSQRADVTVLQADLASVEDMARVVAELKSGPVPVGGIVHAAGASGRSPIAKLTWEDIDAQLGAQTYGGWALHEACLDLPELDFFLVHSSVSAVIGGPTQAHYAASFSFLDGLAAWRLRQGLPALSVSWGAWARVGMSARLGDNLSKELQRSGIRYFSPVRALRVLEEMPAAPAGSQWVAGEMEWASIAPVLLGNALYARVVKERQDTGSQFDLTALLARPDEERLAEIAGHVITCVAAALHADSADQIEASTEFVSLGLDSLMALEVKTGLEAVFRVPLPTTLTFDHPSPQHVAEFLDSQLSAARTA